MKYVFPALAVVLMVSGPLRAADKPSYLKDVKPFLAQYCTGCHNGTKAKSGYDLDDYDSLFKGGRKGPAVVAGKPDKSMLIRTLEGTAKRMPPRKYSEQPTAEEIARVKAWVSAGAKDDSSASKEKADNMPAEKSDKGSVSFESDFCRARRD
jgi:hypothetical protein